MWRWLSLFGVSALVAAVVLLPLQLVLALSGAPISADKVSGSVWRGHLEGAVVQGYPVGKIDVSARPLALLTGRLQARLDVEGPIANGAAVVTARPGQLRFDDTALRVAIAPLDLRDTFGAPMSGILNVEADGLAVAFDGRCLGGEATIFTDTLQRSAVRYGGAGAPLSGDGTCTDGAFEARLAGDGPEGSADINVRVSRLGYHTEVVFEPTDRQFAAALAAYGFERDGKRYSLIQRGDVF